MFVLRKRELGVEADVTEDVVSGQIVRVQVTGPDIHDTLCSLVAASGDLASGVNWGIAYYEPMRAAREIPEGGAEWSDLVPSMLSRANEAIARVTRRARVAVLRGRIEGWTNQLDNGFYVANQYLTINPATARLAAAGSGDVVYGRIEATQYAVNVSGQNLGVQVQLSLPNGLL